MKNNQKLSSQEILNGLSMCYRELINTQVSSRDMPNAINRGRAVAALVTAHHREEIMEARRTQAASVLLGAEKPLSKKIKAK